MMNNIHKLFDWILKNGYDFIGKNTQFFSTNYKNGKFLLKKDASEKCKQHKQKVIFLEYIK